MNHSPGSKRLIVLGSTGSIGVSTLEVVDHLRRRGPDSIEVVGLAAGSRVEPLIEQARRFAVGHVAIADASKASQVADALPNVQVSSGPDAPHRLVQTTDATDVCAAIVGAAGLPAAVAAARKGMTIGLANKETLVAAGALVTPLLAKHGARLIPVDSEHSAIFQCLQGRPPGHGDVRRIVLTASGGPFRDVARAEMENATVEEALRHPTWKMGPKITIDSATMMNKALEIIEAHWLFDLPPQKIEVIVHPQSFVHSFVEFMDHSVLAQMGPPDMRTPIQYALTFPQRTCGCSRSMDWQTLRRLDFEPPDRQKFRSLDLAYDVVRAGGTAGAVFNAANEAAVQAFLDRRIRFGRISELVAESLQAIEIRPADTLETVLESDRQARALVNQRVNQTDKQTVS